jgi:hypothetical protein
MIKELVKVANRLDSLGLSAEADLLDRLIKRSFEQITVEDAISTFKRNPDPEAWKRVEPDFYNAISNPNGMEAEELKRLYPGWSRKEYKELYLAMEGSLPELSIDDLLSLLRSHFNPSVPYQMSSALMSKVKDALNSLDIKESDLDESDKKVLNEEII